MFTDNQKSFKSTVASILYLRAGIMSNPKLAARNFGPFQVFSKQGVCASKLKRALDTIMSTPLCTVVWH